MRILMVTPCYPRFKGDFHGKFIENLCIDLVNRGLEIKVLAPRTKTMESYLTPIEVKRFPYLPAKRLELLPESTMNGAPLDRLLQLPPYMISAFISLKNAKEKIVHSHLAIPMGFISSLPLLRFKKIITCHGSDCSLPINKPIYLPFARHALQHADVVTAVSNHVKRQAVRIGAKRVKTIYFGVDVEQFKPLLETIKLRESLGIPKGTFVIGTLGRLVPSKRLTDIIKAVAVINKKIDVIFLIGGDGPDRVNIIKTIEKVNLTNFRFLGAIKNAKLFHGLLDAFVLASISEGLSISLQEAMATGCVPIAASGCGSEELIEDGRNGYLFQPRNIMELSEKILQASLNRHVGKRARETILTNFNSKKSAEQFIELYKNLLK